MLFIKSNIAYLFNKFFNEININKLMTIYCILNKYFKVDVKLFIIISNIIKNFSNFFGLELIVFNYFFLINKLNLNLLDFKSNVSNSKILYLNNFIKSNLTLQNYKIVKLVSDIAQDVSSKFYIRFSPSTTTKYLLNTFLQSIDVLYLRKNKVFNKGRYSRNRQFYRTGVYWCLYINIIAIVGLYFWFYRFVINFGYLWWLLAISLFSFIFAKSIMNNFLNFKNLTSSIKKDFITLYNILFSIMNFIVVFIKNYFNVFIISKFLNIKIIDFYHYIYFHSFFTIFYYILEVPYVYIFLYNKKNYYIWSITLNYNRYFLSTKKNNYKDEFLRFFK